ncbi:MAG: CotH kinase family protein, partial [Candidatus Latescibacterota bacterium]
MTIAKIPFLAALMLLLLLPLSRIEAKLPESLRYSEDGTLLLQGDQAASGLYDPTVLRTFELTFSQSDWWEQLTANYESETEIPADLTVDGVAYPGVGVRFKGMTSYMMTGNSQKKSFNIALDYRDPDQRLMGYKTLNLNNANSDPTFMREALYFDAARRYVPCPKVSFVRLVINGESWGLYVHVEQLNAEMIEEWFDNTLGTRWKVPFSDGDERTGRPDSLAPSRWDSLVPGRTDTLAPSLRDSLGQPPGTGTTPAGTGTAGRLTLAQWLASDQAVDLNGDDRITQADYQIYLQQAGGGRQPTGGGIVPGGGGGTGTLMGNGNGALVWLGLDSTAYLSAYEVKSTHVENPWSSLIATCDLISNAPLADLADTLESVLAVDRWLWFLAVENIFTDEDSYLTKGADYQIYAEPGTNRLHPLQYDGNESFVTRDVNLSPFEGETSTQRPLLSRVLTVPALRQRYLAHYRTILTESFDWAVLGPKVVTYRALIEAEVQADPKKLDTYEEFQTGLAALEGLVTARRTWLLSRTDVAAQAPRIAAVALPTAVAAAKA